MSINLDGSKGINQNTTEVTKIPVGTTAQRPASPSAGMIRFNTDEGYVEWYDDVVDAWLVTSEPPRVIATGGTVTDIEQDGQIFRVHTFTSDGTFEVTRGGVVECLIVAGGGGSGRSGTSTQNSAGGGGGGGVIFADSLQLNATTYSIEVGTGGSGTSSVSTQPGNGGNSSAFGLTALGGGGGGVRRFINGADGGSGGGAGSDNSSNAGSPGQGIQTPGDSGNFGYGNSGGNVDPNGDPTGDPIGGGGGGAGAAASGIVGGPGIFDSKTTKMYASGGSVDVNGSSPGSTATGDGATAPGGNDQNGSDGGSGIVIVRYRIG